LNGPGEVWVERAGTIQKTDASFGSEAELAHAIERILAPLGRRVDEASPMCDARLPDGSRGERGDRPARARRALPDDPQVPPARVLDRGAGARRHHGRAAR